MRPDEIIKTLEDAGFEARYVGGCVRDTLLRRPIHDWDIASQALPEDVMRLFPHCVPTGIRHGTVTVLLGGVSAEVTTYRCDGAYHDGRHPDGVRFVRSLADDLARRDFTINAMAMDEAGVVTDLFGGRDDLARRMIRCVGDPETRFREDALRMLRAYRFAAARRSARRSRASGCGRRRKRRCCPTGLNTLAACWPKGFWKPACGRRPPIFPGFPPCPERRRPGGRRQSCAARRSTRRRSACLRSSAV